MAKGIESNLMAALAYLLGIVSGIALYLMAPRDRLVRFHAIQSMVLGVIVLILSFILMIFSIVLYFIFAWLMAFMVLPSMSIIGLALIALMWCVFFFILFVLWLFLLYKAYKGDRFGLPLIGGLAERYS